MSSVDKLLDMLSQAGYSHTKPREIVLQVMTSTQGCLSPQQVLERGQAIYPRLGLATVYRTLEILHAAGIVRRIHQDDDCHSYALAEKDHGHHIICALCHQAIEFDGCDLHDMFASVSAQTGFVIQQHWLELFGICPSCQQIKDGEI